MTDRPLTEIDYPQTAGEYWALVEANQDVLQDLIATYHPYYRRPHLDQHITASVAEEVCEAVRKQIQEEAQEDPQQQFRVMLSKRDSQVVDLFNAVWWGMPESMESRCAPGFGLLCDLCSEAYVLEDCST